MNWIFDINTKLKLLLSFLIVVVLTITISATSAVSNSSASDTAEEISQVLQKSYGRVSNTQQALQLLNMQAIMFFYEDDEITKSKVESYIKETSARIDSLHNTVAIMNEHIIGTRASSAQYKQNILDLKALTDKYAQSYDLDVIAPLKAGDVNRAVNNYFNKTQKLFFACDAKFKALIDEQVKTAIAYAKDASDPTLMYIGLTFAAFSVVFALAIAFAISGYISRHLNQTIDYCTNIADGNLDFKVAPSYNDDFGRASKAIEAMRSSLNETLTLVLHRTNHTQNSLHELQKVTGTIVEHANSTESQSVTVAAASDEMVSTTTDIARNCENASLSSENSKNITTNGEQKVREAVMGIQEQSRNVQNGADIVKILAQKSFDIGSIVNTIEEIAAQTNLLALNAAIEAARAGEAGRGFAVVADEVRALASRTSRSTQEISNMVTDIQNDANKATESINQSVESMNQLSDEASSIETIFQDITSHVIDVNAQITQIATAAEEQSTATHEISTNIQGITTLTEDVANYAQKADNEILSTIEKLESLKEKLSFFTLQK